MSAIHERQFCLFYWGAVGVVVLVVGKVCLNIYIYNSIYVNSGRGSTK